MVTESNKRDPETILARIRREERGKLTVFLGAAAGVGKTYAMLQAAHERLSEGVDVVVGWVETHGRQETDALVEGLPTISPRIMEYRGKIFREMDLDGLLERRPNLALVDELAHTNIPGSRHPRRYYDVEELLEAGINVYTTVNIQHLESLNDIVAQITGVRVSETIPDHILEKAEQIHLIDIPAEELIQRLKEGKVYAAEMASQALRKFFRPGNINALRELALKQAAQSVNQQMEVYRREQGIDNPWPVGERVLACISSSPFSVHVIRRARRMAANLRTEMIVIYVDTPRHYPLNRKARESLSRNLQLAENLGAEIVILNGHDIAEEVLTQARRRNVTQIVLGKPLKPKWLDIIQGSAVDEIIRGSTGMSVHIIPGESETEKQNIKTKPIESNVKRTSYLWSLIPVVLITGVGKLSNTGLTNIAMLYLLPVLFASWRFGIGPSIAASLAGVLAFDVFFVPPVFRLTVADVQYLITFVVFLVVATVTGTMAERLRYRIQESRIRENRTRSLYGIAREMAAVTDLKLLAEKVVEYLSKTIDGEAVILVEEADDRLKVLAASNTLSELAVASSELAVANWAFKHNRITGCGTDTLPGADGIYFPLTNEQKVIGVLGIKPMDSLLTPEQRDLLEAVTGLLALAIEKLRLAAETQLNPE